MHRISSHFPCENELAICFLDFCSSFVRYHVHLKNVNGDLTSFDMELLEARDAAQNRPFWRMLASYTATHP